MQNAYIFNNIFKQRKAQAVLPLTIGFVLFNVFVYILVGAFAADPQADDIGNSAFGQLIINESETSNSEMTFTETRTMLSRFFLIFFDMPWWVTAFIIMVNLVLVPLMILAWIRGV